MSANDRLRRTEHECNRFDFESRIRLEAWVSKMSEVSGVRDVETSKMAETSQLWRTASRDVGSGADDIRGAEWACKRRILKGGK